MLIDEYQIDRPDEQLVIIWRVGDGWGISHEPNTWDGEGIRDYWVRPSRKEVALLLDDELKISHKDFTIDTV